MTVRRAILLALVVYCVPGTASAACQAQVDETAILDSRDAEALCLAGSVQGDGAHLAHWTIGTGAAGLWHITIEGMPGRIGGVALARTEDGNPRPIWRGATSASSARAASPPMLLKAGDYTLTTAAAEGTFAYRLRLEPGPALPAELAPGTAVSGPFIGLVRAEGWETVVPWSIGSTEPGALWNLTAQIDPGATMTLGLRDAAGSAVAVASSAEPGGTLRLADLSISPGDYQLILGGAADGQPAILSATTEIRPAGFASEPDGTPGVAHTLAFGTVASGRLVAGAGIDIDSFALDIPGHSARLVDVRVTGPVGTTLGIQLVDEQGNQISGRTNTVGSTRLNGLSLRPGRHYLNVFGNIGPDARYEIVVEDLGEPSVSHEQEPNDTPATATRMPVDSVIAGSFTLGDWDYLDLGVSEGLQLWEIEATGESLQSLFLYDQWQSPIVTASKTGNATSLRIPRVLLPPGSNLIGLGGGTGTWLVRARPLGPPVAGEEVEPNDRPEQALTLAMDQAYTGWLDRPGDRDLYAFYLGAETHVSIEINAPPNFRIRAVDSWGPLASPILNFTTSGTESESERFVVHALLPPGDHVLTLASPLNTASTKPYRLRIHPESRFLLPTDLEPNNEPWQARSVPDTGTLSGQLHGNDTDWFELPDDLPAGSLEMVVNLAPAPFLVQLARRTPHAIKPVGSAYVSPGQSAALASPGGDGLLLSVTGGDGPYDLELRGLGPARQAANAIVTDLILEASEVAAFEPREQRIEGNLSIWNRSAEPLELGTSAWFSDERWRIDGLPGMIAIAGGAKVGIPVVLVIAPHSREDSGAVVEIALRGEGTSQVIARATFDSAIGAPPSSPHPPAGLPPGMLGGLNLAASVFGGSTGPNAAGLIDGIVDANGVILRTGEPLDIDLAGDDAFALAGVILYPPPGADAADRLAKFAIEIPSGASSFARVLHARASPLAHEQAFAFPFPVRAGAVRFIPLSRHGGPSGDRVAISEIKVVADPSVRLFADGVDLARPDLGGRVVRASGFGANQALTGQDANWPSDSWVPVPENRSGAPEWIMGFLNNRVARISQLAWHRSSNPLPELQMREVEVATSTDGPFGPWTDLGTWRTGNADGGIDVWALDQPIWAKLVRLRLVDPPSGPVVLPARIEIFEDPAASSILGEWGDMSTDGPYDTVAPPTVAPTDRAPVGHDIASATPLELGQRAQGQVLRGVDEDWYALDLPVGTRTINIHPEGNVASAVALTLIAPGGEETDFTIDADGVFSAPASEGSWLLRVSQPVQSVVVTWDTSSSLAQFARTIVRVVQQLAWRIDPEDVRINLVPFRGDASAPLLKDWTGDPAILYGALHAYQWRDESSDAETAFLVSALAVNERPGSRAIVIITDADYTGVFQDERLWEALRVGRSRVFALHLPVNNDPKQARAQANLMLDWAHATGGVYQRFASQGDASAAFDRALAWLGQPASYAFVAEASRAPPLAGGLALSIRQGEAVVGQETVATPQAVEIVLDASGSMLRKLDGIRRIDVARKALAALADQGLPQGTDLALRVLGQGGAGSCASDLILPLAPFDAARFASAVALVEPVNLAKTPIGDSIRMAGENLAGRDGQKLIVLLTDGEETCDGNPEAEIARLREAGLDVRLNIVGFALDDPALGQVFANWANLGGGSYYAADDEFALREALGKAVRVSFEIFTADGTIAGSGFVGEKAVELPPGTYSVRVAGRAAQSSAVVQSGVITTLEISVSE